MPWKQIGELVQNNGIIVAVLAALLVVSLLVTLRALKVAREAYEARIDDTKAYADKLMEINETMITTGKDISHQLQLVLERVK